jgi:hypothetical protein
MQPSLPTTETMERIMELGGKLLSSAYGGEIPEIIKELPEVNDTLNTPFDLILANRLDLPAKDGG